MKILHLKASDLLNNQLAVLKLSYKIKYTDYFLAVFRGRPTFLLLLLLLLLLTVLDFDVPTERFDFFAPFDFADFDFEDFDFFAFAISISSF